MLVFERIFFLFPLLLPFDVLFDEISQQSTCFRNFVG